MKYKLGQYSKPFLTGLPLAGQQEPIINLMTKFHLNWVGEFFFSSNLLLNWSNFRSFSYVSLIMMWLLKSLLDL
jgi:hypothetical protein